MKTIKHFIALLLCLSLCLPLVQAQPAPDKQQEAPATKPIVQDVLIIIQQEQVRFTTQKAVAEMQLQVFDRAGQLVYDSGAVTEPELIWVLRQANGEMVKSGLYAYTLSVKEAGADTAKVRRGHFIVDRAKERDGQTDKLWITSQNDSGVGTELTVARTEGATVAGASATASGREDRDEQTIANIKNGAATLAVNGTGVPGRIAKFTSTEELGNSEMFDQNGKIGIGTTSPLSKFHVVSGTSDILPPRLQSSSTSTFAAGWDFYHGSTGKGYVGVPDGGAGLAPGEMLIYSAGTTSLWAGGQRSITITPNNSVGIGTNAPFASTRLHVIGDNNGTAVYGNSTSGFGVIGSTTNGIGVAGVAGPNGFAGDFDGTVRVRGNLVPADFGMFDLGRPDTGRWRTVFAMNGTIQTSDARLKKGVTNLRYGLRELMQLRPVSFEWKDNSDSQQHLGFIAQETEQIIPEAVMRDADPATPLGMNYTTLIPVVIKAIQEQQNTMTTLKNDNEALQERNATLQRQNADLDTRLKALEQTMQQLLRQSKEQAPKSVAQ